MRAGRSPGARSGPKFLGWYVDAVNGLAEAGFARAAPEPPHRARGRLGTDSTFLHTPLRRLSARRSESRLEGGVNRAKLKFTNINTTSSRVSVSNKEMSP
jgi:hypothetical protein